MDIVEFRGSFRSFIEPQPGDASLNIFNMIRRELVSGLRSGLKEATTSALPVRRTGLRLKVDAVETKLNLEVLQVQCPADRQTYYLVLFERDRRIQHRGKSTQEFVPMSERMRFGRKEHRQNKEALRTAAEEMFASNEELQSSTADIQTGREELQIMNEELESMNDELQRRNADVTEAYIRASDLIQSLQIPCIVVDDQLKIQRFTPAAEQILNVIPGDVGRPISEIEPAVKIGMLADKIRKVIQELTALEEIVMDSQGHSYLLQIRPYRREGYQIEGAVVFMTQVPNEENVKPTSIRNPLLN